MPNDISAYIPQVLSQAVMQLRENAIMPRLINTDYSNEVKEFGDSVDIPIATALESRDVVPSVVAPAPTAIVAKKTQLKLDNWKEVSFALSDKELTSVMRGAAPGQLREAVKRIANDIDTSILKLYKEVYGIAGTAGVTPFASSTAEVQEAHRTLAIQQAPSDDRRIVLDPFAEAQALGLPVFQQYMQSGSTETLVNGRLGKKLNFEWVMDQNVQRHVAGTGTGFAITQANHKIDDEITTIGGGGGALAIGDVFNVAGDPQTYVVKKLTGATLEYAPAAKQAWAQNAAITTIASHTANLAFHRDAFGFASRPMTDVFGGGNEIMSMVDPISGVVLRLEVSRQNKQTQWSLDCLWGVKCVMPQLACRIMGQ